MDIDFLRKKTKKQKTSDQVYDIEYTKPVSFDKTEKPIKVENVKPQPKPIPKPAPKPKGPSLWQSIFGKKKSKPVKVESPKPEKALEKTNFLKTSEEKIVKVNKEKKAINIFKTPEIKKPEIKKIDKIKSQPKPAPKSIPKPAPKPKKPKGPSLWQSIFGKKKPKPVKAENPKPKPKLEIKKEEKKSEIKPEQKTKQRKEEGVVLPPKVNQAEVVRDLDKKELNKIKNKELSKGFLGVNLIPKELIDQLRPTTKIRGLLWTAVFALSFILVIYGSMLVYQSYLFGQVLQTQEEIKKVEKEISSYSTWQKEAIAFDEKIKDISQILDQHIYWSGFFSLLEKYTLPNVYYSNLSGDVAGTFTLSAIAPDYKTVTQQIYLFEKADFIKSVSITSATSQTETVTEETTEEDENKSTNTEDVKSIEVNTIKFNISLVVEPDIFYSQN